MKTFAPILLALAASALATPVTPQTSSDTGLAVRAIGGQEAHNTGLRKRRMCNTWKCLVCEWIDTPEYCERKYNNLVGTGDSDFLKPNNETMKA